MSGTFADGCRFRGQAVVHGFTQGNLAPVADPSILGAPVARELVALGSLHGKPTRIPLSIASSVAFATSC